MKLITEIPIQSIPNENKFSYESQIGLLGSCFSENIGDKLKYFKFRTTINPFGILFNPKAIEAFVGRVVHNELIYAEELIFHNERYHCFDSHSVYSSASKEETIQQLNYSLKSFQAQLTSLTHVVITLGTAWCYKYKKTNSFVANCHKVPQVEFDKVLLSVELVESSLKTIVSLLKSANPNLKVIFTVSPVRHIKDGFIENMRSKSHLISAIHKILKTDSVYYFPSYEIMMDELRDYRFYNADMIHPNSVAIDYIWDKFKLTWILDKSFALMKDVEFIQKGLAHKPFNPSSEAHKAFLSKVNDKIEVVSSKYDFIYF